MNDVDLKSPDVFSGELHFALLSEGLRGPMHRRLMRVSRGDAELGRIYETKVGEFRRFLRSSRRPSLWNLPTRTVEWIADNVKVTRPREVFMTLVYVVLAVMVVETAKRQLSTAAPAADFTLSSPLGLDVRYGYPRITSGGSHQSQSTHLDDWMLAELERASRSEAWRAALAKQLALSLEDLDVADALQHPPAPPAESRAPVAPADEAAVKKRKALGEPVAASAAKKTTGAKSP
jgi:hypothetical protein